LHNYVRRFTPLSNSAAPIAVLQYKRHVETVCSAVASVCRVFTTKDFLSVAIAYALNHPVHRCLARMRRCRYRSAAPH
jgi:hypothetical protein